MGQMKIIGIIALFVLFTCAECNDDYEPTYYKHCLPECGEHKIWKGYK